jgi:hypothetical protein
LSGTKVTDAIIGQLGALPNLTVLKLNSTKISGKELGKLSQIKNLKLLYLNGTAVTLPQIQALSASKSLQKVFGYETPAALELTSAGKVNFSFLFEGSTYSLPKLATDSIVY